MFIYQKSLCVGAALCVVLLFATFSAANDKHSCRSGNGNFILPAVYVTTCGGCHVAYPAWLLPATSWSKIMSSLGDHFGAEVAVAPEDAASVESWLKEQAAGSGASHRGDKVARRLSGQSPLRVTDTPWFAHKHRKVRAAKNFADCGSCHKDAAQGIYSN